MPDTSAEGDPELANGTDRTAAPLRDGATSPQTSNAPTAADTATVPSAPAAGASATDSTPVQATDGTTAAEPTAEADAAEVTSRLAETVERAFTRGPRELRVQLRPPELGQLTVRVTDAGDGAVRVAVDATHAEARDLIQQQLPALRAALEARDFRVDRVDVQLADAGESGLSSRDEARDEPRGGDREADTPQGELRDRGHDESGSSDAAATPVARGRIDVRA